MEFRKRTLRHGSDVLVVNHRQFVGHLLSVQGKRILCALCRVNVGNHEVERILLLNGQNSVRTFGCLGVTEFNRLAVRSVSETNFACAFDGHAIADIAELTFVFTHSVIDESRRTSAVFHNLCRHYIGFEFLVGHLLLSFYNLSIERCTLSQFARISSCVRLSSSSLV